VRFLLDSHLLVWLAAQTTKLPMAARQIIEDDRNTLFLSSASIWELTIKYTLGRDEIPVHPKVLHRSLQYNDFQELEIRSDHAFALERLPPIHKDPFDRILIAQAISEDMMLMTSDETIAQYEGPIRLVR
jgi:PIN domain nuclease of toxin-antitoxin system